MDSIKISFLLLIMTCLLAGCQSDDAELSNPARDLFEQQQLAIEQYLTENNIITQQNEAGIHYQILTENAAGVAPQPGQVARIFYRIEQLEGGVIDVREASSGKDPFAYTFRASDLNPNVSHLLVPAGLDVMVGTMRQGEEYEFYLPSAYAYFNYSLEDVFPANALVRAKIRLENVFTAAEQRLAEDAEIKDYLLDQHLEEADSLNSGVYYLRTKTGDGQEVSSGSTVQVRYTGSLLDGTVFDTNVGNDRPLLEFTVAPNQVIEGFLLAVQQMQVGEKGTVVIPSHAAYGQGLVAIPYSTINDFTVENATARKIPPYAQLRFDIEVVDVN